MGPELDPFPPLHLLTSPAKGLLVALGGRIRRGVDQGDHRRRIVMGGSMAKYPHHHHLGAVVVVRGV